MFCAENIDIGAKYSLQTYKVQVTHPFFPHTHGYLAVSGRQGSHICAFLTPNYGCALTFIVIFDMPYSDVSFWERFPSNFINSLSIKQQNYPSFLWNKQSFAERWYWSRLYVENHKYEIQGSTLWGENYRVYAVSSVVYIYLFHSYWKCSDLCW